MRLRTRNTGYYSSTIIATLALQKQKMGDTLSAYFNNNADEELEPGLEPELVDTSKGEPSRVRGQEGINYYCN